MSPRKPPNIWALAGWTYGAVILVTILSIVAYYYVAPKRTGPQPDEARTVAVGSVWMPVYPGAMLDATSSTKQERATESTLNFQTKDPADRVLSFYQAAMKKGIFRFATVKNDAGGGTVQSFVHQGKTTVLVTIRTTGDGTHGEIRTVDKDTPN